MPRLLLCAIGLGLAMLVLACSGSDENALPPATGTEEPEPTLVAPVIPSTNPSNLTASPPPAAAASGGAEAPLGIGTYCWTEPGKPSVCVDKIGPITSAQALVVVAGATVSVPNPIAGTPPGDPYVIAYEASVQPMTLNDGTLAWPSVTANGEPLRLTVTAGGIEFRADLPAGRYVVDIGLTFAQGGVSYGLLLEVR